MKKRFHVMRVKVGYIGTNFSEMLIKIENYSRKCIWIYRWWNGSHFVKGGGGGGGVTERELSMLSDRRNAFSILMFGLIFTSFIGTFYRWSQWHWIKYLNIIDVMVWFPLAAITWAKGNQYFICCYEATMNSSASAWLVLWNGDIVGVDWVKWLLFVSTYERYINSVRLG